MIVLTNGTGRIFIPDGESWQVAALMEAGYREWVKNPPVAKPTVPAVFSVHTFREEIASEPVPPTEDESQAERVDWTKCKGVSTEIAAALYYMGLNTKDDLLIFFQANGISALTDIPGVGMKRAKELISFAQAG